MFTKLDSKDIKMLELSAKSEASKAALQEYLSAHSKAEVAWKVFRDSLLLSEDDNSKVGVKKERKFKAGDKVRVLDTRTPCAASFLRVGDITKVVDYKEDQERKWECKWGNPQQRPVVVEDFISKSNGYFEETALELVEEGKPQRKFKVGDTVRVLSATYPLAYGEDFSIGNVGTIVGHKGKEIPWDNDTKDSRPVVVTNHSCNSWGHFAESALALVEKEEKTPNELRAEVIQRAKEFIENTKTKEFTGRVRTVGLPEEGQRITYYDVYVFGGGIKKVCNVEFIVHQEKRTVVALLRGVKTKKVYSKGIAKCNPDDVFNEHLGKAIALGRALGKVVSEFENAIHPTEPVVGHVVEGIESVGFYRRDRKFTLTSKQGDTFYYAEAKEYEPNEPDDFIFNDQIGVIIDDTNAQY